MKLFQPHEHLTAKPKLKFAHLAIFGGVFAAAVSVYGYE